MSNVNTNKFGGALLFILGEFAAAEEEIIEDGGMEVFGEDDQGREGSCEVSINELAQAASDEIKHLTNQLAKANDRVIDSIIEHLYKARWSGDLSDASVSEMRDQLFKTLRDQTMGYWSGHTAYNIAVDGGFLINDKKGANKRLTSLGAMFVEQEQLRKEQE